jgi:hypothetical protein
MRSTAFMLISSSADCLTIKFMMPVMERAEVTARPASPAFTGVHTAVIRAVK